MVSTWAASSRVGTSTSARSARGPVEQAGEDRQQERGGLAGAGLGGGDQVAAREDHRDGLALDRGGLGVAGGAHALEDGLGQPEGLECHFFS